VRYIAIAYVSFFVACIVVATPLGEFVIVNKNMLEEYLVVLLIIFILMVDKKRIICYINSIVNKKRERNYDISSRK
jgi:hypothetical protein|tara:strand:- start:13420 stop:13647 length:228 start_codon:yes stop_codon:yes gene_type:complete